MIFSNPIMALRLIIASSLLTLSQGVFADEFRLGLMRHDVKIPGIGSEKNKELSASVTAEYVFETPQWMAWSKGAKPYIYVSGNLAGNTSYAGFGVNYRRRFFDNFYGEYGLGLSMHNGTIRVPHPDNVDPSGYDSLALAQAEIDRRISRKASEIEFGSRGLIRNQLALGYVLSSRLSIEAVYEHLSHGKLLGGPENEGVDSLGLRARKSF